ncbi:unnamed protein product [Adineta ricciae]|uniref:PDZ domain-containing protein n=1 Tax=Adineta ricciae TaxID=249248 RepID=A0A814L124_ADIRI|nr:unnamed protein product [Adineta ricciae]CAF1110571.1 unnamed protein product [Adineta ricciae]
MSRITQFNYRNHWQEEEIDLERPLSNDQPLGFFITGGFCTTSPTHQFTSIIVTKIIEESLVAQDNRLKVFDIILSVNNVDFSNISEQDALKILRKAGPRVRLIIRRLSPSIIEEIELQHDGKLNLTIAGGIDDEYYLNDPGVFIIGKKQQQANTSLNIGDRLLEISSTKSTYDLRFVTFDEAQRLIRLACAESQTVKISVAHAIDAVELQNNENEVNPVIPEEKEEGSANVSRIDMNDDLIVPFDVEDVERYERCGRRVNSRLVSKHMADHLSIVAPVTHYSRSARDAMGMDSTPNYYENIVYPHENKKEFNLYATPIHEAQTEIPQAQNLEDRVQQ